MQVLKILFLHPKVTWPNQSVGSGSRQDELAGSLRGFAAMAASYVKR